MGLCCILVLFAGIFRGLGHDNEYSSTDIVVNDTLTEPKSLEILNMTNITIKPSKITFVYYDHNTSKWNGCYGLNYTVLSDSEGNSYMLDHATTDILGKDTNYTFKYPKGIGLVYDNNTETEIYNNSGLYYIHEVRGDEGNVIKSLGNFTLYDKSHEPEFRPVEWTFIYNDHNSSEYEGDEGLRQAIAINNSSKHEVLYFCLEKEIIGLAYESNKTFNFSYGLSGLEARRDNVENIISYTVWGSNLCYPNGTEIETFDIRDYGLLQDQKDFITNYDNRIDEVRHKQEINDIRDAESDAYESYLRYQENHNSKAKYSTYYGTNGYGVIRSY